jgi:hypothetical protein
MSRYRFHDSLKPSCEEANVYLLIRKQLQKS